jgi:hypothetical protein
MIKTIKIIFLIFFKMLNNNVLIDLE